MVGEGAQGAAILGGGEGVEAALAIIAVLALQVQVRIAAGAEAGIFEAAGVGAFVGIGDAAAGVEGVVKMLAEQEVAGAFAASAVIVIEGARAGDVGDRVGASVAGVGEGQVGGVAGGGVVDGKGLAACVVNP